MRGRGEKEGVMRGVNEVGGSMSGTRRDSVVDKRKEEPGTPLSGGTHRNLLMGWDFTHAID